MIAYLASDFIFLLLLFEIQNILRKEIAAKGHFSVWKMCVSHIWSFILKAGAALPITCQSPRAQPDTEIKKLK